MRLPAKRILGIVLPIAVLLISSPALAHELSQGDQISGAKGDLSAPAPELVDIISSVQNLTEKCGEAGHNPDDHNWICINGPEEAMSTNWQVAFDNQLGKKEER